MKLTTLFGSIQSLRAEKLRTSSQFVGIWLLYVGVQCMDRAQKWNNTRQPPFFNKSCVLSDNLLAFVY